MAYQYADYSGKSQRVIAAGQLLIDSLNDTKLDRSIAIQDLESAAQGVIASEAVLRFSAPAGDESPPSAASLAPDDALSGVLLDLQTANVLISSGIALGEHGGQLEVSLLSRSLDELESARTTVISDLSAHAALAFAPVAGVKSSNLEEAKKTFRENANGILDEIVNDANSVVNDVLEKLKKLDSSKIMEAINKLGESFEVVAATGRLIRQGLDLLKRALDALLKLFGEKMLTNAKEKVVHIWERFESGQYTQMVLARIFDVNGTRATIESALGQANIDLTVIDNATNDLPGLSDKYQRNMKLLRSLMSAVAVAGSIIAFLNVAAPWIPLAIAGVYAALIAATLLIGMDYSDSGRVLRWVRGVGEIANSIKLGP